MKLIRSAGLSLALLFYMSIIILLLTLLPFRFHIPEHFNILVWAGWEDVIANIFLFLPLGFLYQLVRRRRKLKHGYQAFLFGFLFSAAIEIGQLFLAGRYSSPLDVMTNAMGAWLGAIICLRLHNYINRRALSALSLELPMMNIIYLMIPLIWLSGMGIGDEHERIWFSLLTSLMGAIVLVEIFYYRVDNGSDFPPVGWAAGAGIWFIISSVPAMLRFPMHVLFFGALTFLLVWGGILLCQRREIVRYPSLERRFEARTLKRVLIVYSLYLFLMVYWPFEIPNRFWHGVMDLSIIAQDPPLVITFRLLEAIAAVTLLGYMVSELLGREHDLFRSRFIWVFIFIVSISAELELLRGFHPDHQFSLLRFAFTALGGLAGVAIYRLQLSSFLRLREW